MPIVFIASPDPSSKHRFTFLSQNFSFRAIFSATLEVARYVTSFCYLNFSHESPSNKCNYRFAPLLPVALMLAEAQHHLSRIVYRHAAPRRFGRLTSNRREFCIRKRSRDQASSISRVTVFHDELDVSRSLRVILVCNARLVKSIVIMSSLSLSARSRLIFAGWLYDD